MPRTVAITLPSARTEDVINKVEQMHGLVGMKLQKNGSLKPKGDVLTLEVTNRSMDVLMRLLDENKLLDDSNVNVTTSHPLSVISKSHTKKINTDRAETTWEEVLSNLNRQSLMSINSMMTMFFAGVIAVIGITTNAIHVVVGAMIIAPAFEPLARISLGVLTKTFDWQQGIKDTLKAYSAFLAGVMACALLMQAMGLTVMGGEASYLPETILVSHWTSITKTSVLIAVAAAAAGGYVIATNRSVLTAGVMVALALVPSLAITGMGIIAGDFAAAGKAFQRLALETGIVILVTGIVIFIQKLTVQKRNMKG